MGGVIPAIEKGYFQYEISRSASSHQKKIDNKELIHVGVKEFEKINEEIEIPIIEIWQEVESYQKNKIRELRKNRNDEITQQALKKIQKACKNGDNLLPSIIAAAKAHATMGEIVIKIKDEFGEWNETSVF